MMNTRMERVSTISTLPMSCTAALFFVATAIGLTIGSSAAQAEQFKIGQSGQKFSERKIAASVGDTLHFVNDDNVVHQVTINEIAVDSGAMDPGAEFSTELSEPGDFKVRCSIHPRMRIKLSVQ